MHETVTDNVTDTVTDNARNRNRQCNRHRNRQSDLRIFLGYITKTFYGVKSHHVRVSIFASVT